MEHFITTGDRLASVLAVFKCKNQNTADAYGAQLMSDRKILAVMERWKGPLDGRVAFLERLRTAVRKKNTSLEVLRFFELEARVAGYDVSGRQIQARAQLESATLKKRREKNITQVLKLREVKYGAPKDQWGLKEMEAEQDANPGNGVAGG